MSNLVDWAGSLMRKYENADTKKQQADPGMVEEANESFRKKAGKKLTADGPTLGGKKKAKAKTRKALARKKD